MPVESGPYCQYCTNDRGELQPFSDRFEAMVQWTLRGGEAATREEAEDQTLTFMSSMPAWRDHPELLDRLT